MAGITTSSITNTSLLVDTFLQSRGQPLNVENVRKALLDPDVHPTAVLYGLDYRALNGSHFARIGRNIANLRRPCN